MRQEEGWVRGLFAALDAMDTPRFLDHLVDDARFRFGNAPHVVGRAAIGRAVDEFFAGIRGLSHQLDGIWLQPGATLCNGHVTYTLYDDRRIYLPFADVWLMQGERIRDYLVYIDLGPLLAASASVREERR